MKIINKIRIISILISTASGFLTSCEKVNSDGISTINDFCIPDSLLRNLSMDTVKSDFITSNLKLAGKITFNEDKVVRIFPLVSGHIVEVKVTLGDFVKKGQVLAEVNSSEMAGYFNDYKIAESQLSIAKKNLEVTGDMRNSGVSSEKDYITAQKEYEQAQSAFNKVKEIIKIYGRDIRPNDSVGTKYTIKAPIDGFIVEKNVNSGMELRADDANSLFTISDLSDVWAIANVYETDIPKIKEGSEVQITTLSYPDRIFKGSVERVSNVLNPETNAMTVKIKLANTDFALKPGMYANVDILFPEQRKKLFVPSTSVLFDDNSNYVIVYKKRCDVDLRRVEVEKTFNNMSFIDADSVHEGDLVIDRNGLFVFTALKKL